MIRRHCLILLTSFVYNLFIFNWLKEIKMIINLCKKWNLTTFIYDDKHTKKNGFQWNFVYWMNENNRRRKK